MPLKIECLIATLAADLGREDVYGVDLIDLNRILSVASDHRLRLVSGRPLLVASKGPTGILLACATCFLASDGAHRSLSHVIIALAGSR
jgi:hypothetical protein